MSFTTSPRPAATSAALAAALSIAAALALSTARGEAACGEASCPADGSAAPRDYVSAARPDAARRPPGDTRAATGVGYALVAPDNRVPGAPLPGWAGGAVGEALVTPALGAHFALYLVHGGADAVLASPTGFEGAVAGLERFFFVLTGALDVWLEGGEKFALRPGAFLYVAPGGGGVERVAVAAEESGTVFLQLDRVYAGAGKPKTVHGYTENVAEEVPPGEVFRLRRLLDAADPAYDFNIHIMDFSPGEYLAIKERHYNQHGLLMLEGEGIYMLQDQFMPVQAGDAIWMAPFCTQWYAALGASRTRYWLYKDTNADPLVHNIMPPFARHDGKLC